MSLSKADSILTASFAEVSINAKPLALAYSNPFSVGTYLSAAKSHLFPTIKIIASSPACSLKSSIHLSRASNVAGLVIS